VQAAVAAAIEGRDLWLLGEPRVNVLLLNLALDRQFGRTAPARAQEPKNRDEESSASAQPSIVSNQPGGD
jgi:hypothetical protein